MDLHNEELRIQVDEFNSLFNTPSIVTDLADCVPSLKLKTSAADITIKLQYNSGHGGCFPLHYDNPGLPNKRKVTILTYLNEEWKEGDGGELMLQPFLEKTVVIPPLMGRVVIFRSDLLLHRVLPAMRPRYCFTIWVDSDLTNTPE